MATKKDTARIDAANHTKYNDATFAALYKNSGVTWFGESEDLKAVEKRAGKLRLTPAR